MIQLHIPFSSKLQGEFLAGNCDKVIGGYDFVNNDADPMDGHSHGTHVAGIVASTHPTYRGVAPDAKLLAVKVCNDTGSCPTSDIIAGIDWCIDNKDTYNITILTMSVGCNGESCIHYQTPCDSASEAP